MNKRKFILTVLVIICMLFTVSIGVRAMMPADFNPFLLNIAKAMRTMSVLLVIEYIIIHMSKKIKDEDLLYTRLIVTIIVAVTVFIGSSVVKEIAVVSEGDDNLDLIPFEYIEW